MDLTGDTPRAAAPAAPPAGKAPAAAASAAANAKAAESVAFVAKKPRTDAPVSSMDTDDAPTGRKKTASDFFSASPAETSQLALKSTDAKSGAAASFPAKVSKASRTISIVNTVANSSKVPAVTALPSVC